MAIHFYCPLGHRLVVPDERSGKKGRCPICNQLVIAPVPNPQPSGRQKQPSPLDGAPAENSDFAIDSMLSEELGLNRDED